VSQFHAIRDYQHKYGNLGGFGEETPKGRLTDGATGPRTSTLWSTFSTTAAAIDQV
jgi:hypothetical protein